VHEPEPVPSTTTATIRRALFLAAFVAVSSAYVLTLDYQSLNPDELFSIYLAKQDHSFISGYAWRADTNPPLHALLLKTWCSVFGYSAAATRALSLLAVFAATAVVFRIARACGPQPLRHRASSALLFLASTTVAFYGLDTRPYALWLLFVSISTLGLVKLAASFRADDEQGLARLAPAGLAYVIGAVAGLYTHVTTLPYVAAANVAVCWMWARDRRSRAWPKVLLWCALQAVILVAILPQLFISASQIHSHILDWIPPTTVAGFPRPIVELIAGNYAGKRLLVVGPLVFVAIGLWLCAGWHGRKSTAPLQLLFILSASGFVIVVVLSLARPIYVAHTLAWMLIPMSIVTAPSTISPDRRWVLVSARMLIILSAINTGWYLWGTPQYPWREFLAEAKPRVRPTDVVVLVGNAPVTEIAYYLPEQLESTRRWVPEGYPRFEQTSSVLDDRIFAAPPVSVAELRRDLEEGMAVWLVQRDAVSLVAQVDTAFEHEIGATATVTSQWSYGTISLRRYSR
jgi:hypothetical protein